MSIESAFQQFAELVTAYPPLPPDAKALGDYEPLPNNHFAFTVRGRWGGLAASWSRATPVEPSGEFHERSANGLYGWMLASRYARHQSTAFRKPQIARIHVPKH